MSIEVMKQALEALTDDRMVEVEPDSWELRSDLAIAALRAAIEEAEKPWVKSYAGGKPQYTTPEKQQRKWKGLTDEELDVMRQESKLDFVTFREFRVVARAIEAKLKERNT